MVMTFAMSDRHPIQDYRDKHSLTQEGLGKLVGVEAGTISRWEQRKRTPRGDDLRRLCATTGISAAVILGISEPVQ